MTSVPRESDVERTHRERMESVDRNLRLARRLIFAACVCSAIAVTISVLRIVGVL